MSHHDSRTRRAKRGDRLVGSGWQRRIARGSGTTQIDRLFFIEKHVS